MIESLPSPGRRRAITFCVVLATIMQTIDTTIANISLPYMQGTLSATLDQINWVVTSYIIAVAIMIPPTGWLAGRFGRRRLFLISVAGFTAVSMLCGLATSLEQMVVFRALQGALGAPLIPLSQSVLLDIYPRQKHGYAMAVWGLGTMIGPIMGPTVGAYLTEYYHWRWVFYINLPFGVLTFIGLSAALNETWNRNQAGFDWFGFGTLSLAVGMLQLMLDRGEHQDWFASTEIIVECALAGLGFYLFVVHSLTTPHPFLDRALFLDRNYVASLLFTFAVGIILLAAIAVLTPFLQLLVGLPIVTAGLVLGPRGIGTVVTMMFISRLVNAVDARLLLMIGFGLLALSLWQMTGFTADVDIGTVMFASFVQGLGLGLIWVPLSTTAFATLPAPLRTQAASLVSLVRNLGSSIGISVVIFLLGYNTRVARSTLAEQVTIFNDNIRDLTATPLWNLSTRLGHAAIEQEMVRQATTIAYIVDFKLMMVVALVTIPMLLLLKPVPRAGTQGQRLATE